MRRGLRCDGHDFFRCLVGLVVCLCGGGFSLATLINYEKDPDLEQAMKCDAEYNGGDMKITSQTQAEKYYLKYLERCTESSQRAKVYSQLGVLFATNWYAELGEKPDFEKSVMYMKKALEEEPTRIGYESIRARAFLLTPLNTREESMDLRIENYGWLLATQESISSVDASSDIWLPEIPGEPLPEGEFRAVRGVLVNMLESQGINLISEATSFPDPIDKMRNLQRIVGQFPGTTVAEKASKAIADIKAKLEKDPESEFDAAGIEGLSLGDTEKTVNVSTGLANEEGDVVREDAANDVMPREDETTGYLGILLVATASLIVCALIYMTYRRRVKQRGAS